METTSPAGQDGPTAPRRPRGAPRGSWALAGVLAGLTGLATSYVAAMALTVRESPVVAVSEMLVRLTPGAVVEFAIDTFGGNNKTILLTGVLVALVALTAYAGVLARRSWWHPSLVFVPLAVVATVAVVTGPSPGPTDVLPVAVGLVTWLVALSLLTDPLRAADEAAAPAAEPAPGAGAAPRDPARVAATRRTFLVRTGVLAAGAAVLGVAGRLVGEGRRAVEATRSLLRLPISQPVLPEGVATDLPGIAPWRTSNADFYRIHTAIVMPTIDPADWSLRIHGLVDREVVLTYQDLLDRELTEAWVTLCCVSNEIGGDLVGNAWWSGVRIADVLAEAGVSPDADCVLQTSEDGWTCSTPLSALTDDRDAMLAIGMNGQPLPIDHGFPVRMVVPGLYGYVSATKWLVDLEVTRFEDVSAYWTERGWGEMGPVKTMSRVDVPRSGAEVPAGSLRVGGVAWAQHTGIQAVEVAVDGGSWQEAQVLATPTDDTWVQWVATVEVEPGDHTVRVRATDKSGYVQTGVERDVLPDGATGWHEVDFTATEA